MRRMKPRVFAATVAAGLTVLIVWEWLKPRVLEKVSPQEAYHPLVKPEVKPDLSQAEEPWWKFF